MDSKIPGIYLKETHYQDELPVQESAQIKPESKDVDPQLYIETVVVKEELILEDENEEPNPEPEPPQENRVILASGYEITIKDEPPPDEDEEPGEQFQNDAIKEEPAPEEAKPQRAAPLRCGKCKKLYHVATAYKAHCQRHRNLDRKRFFCKPCRKAFGSQRDLTRHERGTHGLMKGKMVRVYKCRFKFCDKKFDNEDSFKEHLQAHRIVDKKLFRCEKCEKCFSSRNSLNKHVKYAVCDKGPRALEEADGIFRCSKCSKRFSHRYLIDQHIRRHLARLDFRSETNEMTEEHTTAAGSEPIVMHRNGVEFFKCPICFKLIRQRYPCVRHIRRHIAMARATFQCGTCELYLANKKELVQHEVEKHGKIKPEPEGPVEINEQGQFKCSECTKTFTQRRLAKRHIRRHKALEEGAYQCKICGKFFGENAELVKHAIEKHKEAPKKVPKVDPLQRDPNGRFKCTQCELTFALRAQCSAHIRRHKIKDSGQFRCKKCLKCFVKQTDLEKHERAATSLTKSICSKAQRLLQVNKEKLAKQSDQEYQVMEQNGTFICSSCGKVFLQRRFCVAHIRRHVDIDRGRFKCETCGAHLGTNKELRKHAAKKHGISAGVVKNPLAPIKLEQDTDGWFKCTECPERFRKRLSCTKHIRRHEHVRTGKYQCGFEACGIRFASNYELKRHMISVHENDKLEEASTSNTTSKEEKSEEIIPDAS